MRGDIGCGLQMVWYNSCQSMVMSVNGYILTKGEMRSVQSLFKLGRRKSKTKNDEHTRTRSSSGSLLISTTRPLLLIKLDSASNQSCFLQQDPTNLTEFLLMPHFYASRYPSLHSQSSLHSPLFTSHSLTSAPLLHSYRTTALKDARISAYIISSVQA